jgi:hypothetical protein
LRPQHAHYFHAISTKSQEHRHVVYGYTYSVNGSSTDKHIHTYTGITTFDHGHYHRYYGVTGPAIPLPDGSHYHEIQGRVYFNYNVPVDVPYGGVVYKPTLKEKHDHRYKGLTSKGIGYDIYL